MPCKSFAWTVCYTEASSISSMFIARTNRIQLLVSSPFLSKFPALTEFPCFRFHCILLDFNITPILPTVRSKPLACSCKRCSASSWDCISSICFSKPEIRGAIGMSANHWCSKVGHHLMSESPTFLQLLILQIQLLLLRLGRVKSTYRTVPTAPYSRQEREDNVCELSQNSAL